MRPTFLALVLGAAALAAPFMATPCLAETPATASADVDRLVAKVQSFYDKTTSFKSDFNQEFYVKAYDKRKSSHGKVTFAKPGKMDWVYDDPKDNRVVSDGSLIKVYEASNHQMFEQNLTASQYPAALAFLTGQGKLADLFSFEIPEGMIFPGGTVLAGTPKVATPAYTKVIFYIDNPTAQVRRVMIVDGQGNRNRFDFEHPRVNEPVSADQFKLTPPPGTTVVRP